MWRAESADGEKTLLRDWHAGLTFADMTAEPETRYRYFIQAAKSATGDSASGFSAGVIGWRAAAPTSVKVSFDAAGGTVATSSADFELGETYGELPTPTYAGQVFLGWHTAATGGMRVDASSAVRAEVTGLFAHWIADNEPRLENLFARQRYPWNGYVDVSFSLAGVADGQVADVTLAARSADGNTSLPLRTWIGEGPTNLANGAHSFVWNSVPDAGTTLHTNLTLAATLAVRSLKPAAPASVSATSGTSTAGTTLGWTAVAGATGYVVYRGTSGDSAAATQIGTTSETGYTDTTGTPGVLYYYWVASVNAAGPGDFGTVAAGYRKLSMPTGVSATDGTSADSTTVTWTGADGATKYYVYRYTYDANRAAMNVSQNLLGTTTSTSYTDATGTPGVTYYYYVRAYAQSSGSYSMPSEGDAGSRKKVPVSLAIGGASSVLAGKTATYTATVTYNDNDSKTVTPNWSLASGSSYGSIASSGVFSAGGTATQRSVTIAASYTEAGATVADTKAVTVTTVAVTVTFDGNGGTPGVSSRTYTVYGTYGSLPSATYSGYAFDGWYTASEGGAPITVGTVVQESVKKLYAHWKPDAIVSDLTSSSGKSTLGVDLSWSAVSSASDYLVYRNENADPGSAVLLGRTWGKTEYRDIYRGARGGKVYNYWVRSVVGNVTNSFSGPVVGFRLPPDPKNVAASKGTYTGKVQISWSSSSGAVAYSVYRHTLPVWENKNLLGTTATTYYDDESAVSGVRYYYWVVAVGENGSESPMGAYDTGYVGTVADGSQPTYSTPGAQYKVIDLSGGTAASTYPVHYLDDVPAGGWTEEYKTTKLVMRLVTSGGFAMGSPADELGRRDNEDRHQVVITEPFYIGIFPVTASQWRLVSTNIPNYFPTVGSLPADEICYSWVRGASIGNQWPQSAAVDEDSFLGILRSKTGDVGMDLPTEAQWEYACRAGTDSAYNSGLASSSETADERLSKLGRYLHNGGGDQNVSGWSVNVGMYAANRIGIYDMHGNVGEWCRDWYVGSLSGALATNPVGPASGNYRVRRGGGAMHDARYCRSAARDCASSGTTGGAKGPYGFRIVSSCPKASVPGVPTNVTVSQGTLTTETTVRWTEVDGATMYYIYRSTANDSSTASCAGVRDGLIFSDTTGVAGTLYYYWVKAYNDSGYSGFSTCASGYRKLPAPTNVAATDGTSATGTTVSWSSVSGATKYYVYRSTSNSSSSATSLGSTTLTSYTDTTGTAGTTYYYWVKAYSSSSGSSSAFSSSDSGYRKKEMTLATALDNTSLTFTTGGDTPSWYGQSEYSYDGTDAARSGAISDSQKTWFETTVTGPGTLTFKWRVSSESNYDFLEYLVDAMVVSSISGTDTTSWTTVTKTISGSGTHTIRWQYRKDGSQSKGLDAGFVDQVTWTAGEVAEVPSAPTNVSATDGTSTTGTTISWSSVSGATKYYVYRYTSNSSSSATSLGSTTTTSYTDTTGTAGTTYYYWVKAYNSAGYSSFSAYDTGYRKSSVSVPSAPTSISCSTSRMDGVYVSWGAVSGATSYNVYVGSSMSGTFIKVGTATGTGYLHTSAEVGIRFYKVSAVNSAGESALSTYQIGARAG